ncbi:MULTISPECIES: hypothetical protein [unclassified Flavobacterium]
MINLYWNIGQYIHNRIETERSGKSVQKNLMIFLNHSCKFEKKAIIYDNVNSNFSFHFSQLGDNVFCKS